MDDFKLERRHMSIARSLTAMALGLASLGYGLKQVWPFSIDDAGIVYAYAKHLAAGQGLRAVVGGPIVEGYSDFFWMVLLAAPTKLGFATPLAAKVLGSALLFWTAIAAALFVHVVTKPVAPFSVWPLMVPAVLLGLCPEFVVYAPSGLENGLYGAGLVTALWLDIREADKPNLTAWSAFGALCVALTRPEGILYAAILALAKLRDASKSRLYRRQCTEFFTLLFVPWAAYQIWHYSIFRALVPNTFFAKAPGSIAWGVGVTYVRNGLATTRADLLVPLSLLGVLAGLRRTLPALAAAACALAFALYARGDWMPHFRFVGFALPPLAALAAVGIALMSKFAQGVLERDAARRIAPFALTLAVCGLWFAHHRERFNTVPRLRWCHFCSRSQDAANHQAEGALLGLSQASMLTHDFGGPSYASSRSFFPMDLLGLADQSAALIEYRRQKDGFARAEFARLQYFFHEQPTYPTFLYFPDNFWPGFRATPEFLWGYTDVETPARKDRRNIAPTELFRGAFVDFFPRIQRFRFEPIGNGFRLVGASAWIGPRSAQIDVDLSLICSEPIDRPVSIALRAGGTSGPTISLFGREPSLGRAFRGDEPVSVHLQIQRPSTAAPDEVIAAGIQVAGGARQWVPLLPLTSVRPDVERTPTLPFPNNLPGTSEPTLRKLGRQLRGLIDERRVRGDYAIRDANLAKSLVSSGAAADDRGAKSDAYLAYVWATQADSDQVRFLYQKIASLRPEHQRRGFLKERALLGEFYASGDEFWQLEIAAEYVAQQQWDKARFFVDHLPANTAKPDEIWSREVDRLRALVSAAAPSIEKGAESPFTPRPIPGVASDFEGPLAGWTLRRGAFVTASDDSTRIPVWGVGGNRYLSSETTPADGGGAMGEAQSSAFVVDGRALSFLIAGGTSKDLRVELLVAGKVREVATPAGSRCFFPVIWDLAAFRGQRAMLRIIDHAKDRNAFIAVDDFEIWPFVQRELAAPAEP